MFLNNFYTQGISRGFVSPLEPNIFLWLSKGVLKSFRNIIPRAINRWQKNSLFTDISDNERGWQTAKKKTQTNGRAKSTIFRWERSDRLGHKDEFVCIWVTTLTTALSINTALALADMCQNQKREIKRVCLKSKWFRMYSTNKKGTSKLS